MSVWSPTAYTANPSLPTVGGLFNGGGANPFHFNSGVSAHAWQAPTAPPTTWNTGTPTTASVPQFNSTVVTFSQQQTASPFLSNQNWGVLGVTQQQSAPPVTQQNASLPTVGNPPPDLFAAIRRNPLDPVVMPPGAENFPPGLGAWANYNAMDIAESFGGTVNAALRYIILNDKFPYA